MPDVNTVMVHEGEDGNLCITTFPPNLLETYIEAHKNTKGFDPEAATIDAAVGWAAQRAVRPGTPAFLADHAAIARMDRYFRDAWRLDKSAGRITVDMPAARNVHLANLRAERNAKLQAADLDFVKALEKGDPQAQAAVAQRKAELRDMPETIAPELDKAATLSAIKAVRPKILD